MNILFEFKNTHWHNMFLPDCDGLLRLPGKSSGADKEVALAESKKIPVFHSIEEVEAYYE